MNGALVPASKEIFTMLSTCMNGASQALRATLTMELLAALLHSAR